MNIDLTKEVKSSFILKTYNKVTKFKGYITYFKWIAAISMLLGFVDTFLFNGPHSLTVSLNVGFWIPGIIFAFLFIVLHFWAGLKLRNLSKKYNIHEFQLKLMVDKILN